MKRIADLSIFVAVVKAGSLTEASEELNLSVATISRYLARIEEELGVRILIRNARGLRLTGEGQSLYARVEFLMNELNRTIAQVSASRKTPQGVLKVTSTIALGYQGIAPLVSEFSNLHPDVTVQLSLSDRYVDLIVDDVDVVLSIGAPEDTSLVAKHLISSPCCICASPAYLKNHKMPRRPKDLKKHDCLILDYHGSLKNHWSMKDNRGVEHHVQVPTKLITDNSETLREWLLKGYGIALINQAEVAEYLESGNLVRLMPRFRAPSLDFYLVYTGRTLLPAKTRAFIAFLESNIALLE